MVPGGPEALQPWDAGTELCQPLLLQQLCIELVIRQVAQSHLFLHCNFCEVVWKEAVWWPVWCETRITIVSKRHGGKDPSKEDTQKESLLYYIFLYWL